MARQRGEPDPFPDPVVVAESSAGTVRATPADPPPVPWDAGVLEPLFRSIVPEVEKLDVASLKAKAAGLGDEMIRMVEKDAAWNPVAKTTIISTAPAVVAQTLNSIVSIPQNLAECIQTGRVRGLSCMFATQRPNRLNEAITNEVTECVAFRLQGDNALRRVAELGLDAAAVARLVPGSWISVGCQTGARASGRLWGGVSGSRTP